MQALLCQILLDAGYSVRSASDRMYALRLLRETNPAIVVMDWRHDGMSARGFIASAEGECSNVFFVVTSTNDEDAVLASDLGVRHTLRKPFNVDQLLKAVEECVASMTTGSSSQIAAVS
jgi:DNA-binding response OmpR family regulator